MEPSTMTADEMREITRLHATLEQQLQDTLPQNSQEWLLPYFAQLLAVNIVSPDEDGRHAEVANAIGAVSGGVIQRHKIYIRPLNSGLTFRLHLPEGSKDFLDLELAVDHARDYMLPRAKDLAQQAGANQVEIKMGRNDNRAKVMGHQEVYLGTELVFTAFGRPSFKRD